MTESPFGPWKRRLRLSIEKNVRVTIVSESEPKVVMPAVVAASAVPTFKKIREVSFPTIRSASFNPLPLEPLTVAVGCCAFVVRNSTAGRILLIKSFEISGRSELISTVPVPAFDPKAVTAPALPRDAMVTPNAVGSAVFTSMYKFPGQSGPCKQ